MKKLLLTCVLLSCLTSCSYVPETISVKYQPTKEVLPIATAEKVRLGVQVFDNRRHSTKVGFKKGDGYVEMAAIRLDGSLPDVISKGLETELKNRGFKIDSEENRQAMIEVEIQKFFNDFKKGFFTDRGVAEIIFSVHVKKGNGDIVYSKTIMGLGERDGLWMHSGSNCRAALEEALTDAMHKLLDDQAFIQALTKKV